MNKHLFRLSYKHHQDIIYNNWLEIESLEITIETTFVNERYLVIGMLKILVLLLLQNNAVIKTTAIIWSPNWFYDSGFKDTLYTCGSV